MAERSRIYVGTAGWSYKDWEGIVYPAQLKKTQHPVEYLAQYIDLLEINDTRQHQQSSSNVTQGSTGNLTHTPKQNSATPNPSSNPHKQTTRQPSNTSPSSTIPANLLTTSCGPHAKPSFKTSNPIKTI